MSILNQELPRETHVTSLEAEALFPPHGRMSLLSTDKLYRRAYGNRHTRCVKRFWTEDHYCSFRKGEWQASWLKEEFPVF